MKMNYQDPVFSDLFDSIPEDKKQTALILGAIAAAIINKRHELGLTQKEFANMYGVSQGMVSKWESAEYDFTISNLSELMTKLSITLDVLLNGNSATNQNYADPTRRRSLYGVVSDRTSFG